MCTVQQEAGRQEGRTGAEAVVVEVEDDGDAGLGRQVHEVPHAEHGGAVVVLDRQPGAAVGAQPLRHHLHAQVHHAADK